MTRFTSWAGALAEPGAAALLDTGLIVVKVAAVLLGAWIVLRATRGTSATVRHRVVALALIGSLIVPLLSIVLPPWNVIPVLASMTAATHVAERPLPTDRQPAAPVSQHRPRVSPVPPVPGEGSSAATASAWRPTWPTVMILAWATGTASLLLLLALRVVSMQRASRRSEPIQEADWLALADQARDTLKVRRPVALRRRGRSVMPLVWGLRRPVVLLPNDCDTWSTSWRRAVLYHEIAHVARHDLAVILLGHVACALHWFNPLCWLLKRRLDVEGELACDHLVLVNGYRQTRYADHLLKIAQKYTTPTNLAPVMAAKPLLEERIMAILGAQRNRRSLSRSAQITLATLALTALALLASLAWAEPRPGDARSGSGVRAERAVSDGDRFEQQLTRLGIANTDLDALLRGLDAGDPLTRAACAWALGDANDPRAFDPLVGALDDSDAIVRQWAVRSLGQIDQARAGESLVALVEDDDAEVRQWAVRSLGTLDEAHAIDTLIGRLDDQDAEVRQWAVRQLSGSEDPRAIEALLGHAGDHDAEVREWVVRSLGPAGGEQAVEMLIEGLRDPNADVAEWSARALGAYGDAGVVYDRQRGTDEPLMPGLERGPRRPASAEIIESLIQALASEHVNVREWSVRSLGNVGDERAVDPLLAHMHDDDLEVREWAIRSLTSFDDRRVIEHFVQALEDPSATIREWSIRGLGTLQDQRMVDPLIDRLNDESATVRAWAVRALGAYGDPRGREALGRLRDDPSPEVRQWVDRALENV